MKLMTPAIWISGAVAIFTIAAVQNNLELVPFSFLAGGVGLGTLFPALKQKWSSQSNAVQGDERAIQELETRLRITEDELALALRELSSLKDQRDFDTMLQLGNAHAANAASAHALGAADGARKGV